MGVKRKDGLVLVETSRENVKVNDIVYKMHGDSQTFEGRVTQVGGKALFVHWMRVRTAHPENTMALPEKHDVVLQEVVHKYYTWAFYCPSCKEAYDPQERADYLCRRCRWG